jgi:hypothetical protein
VSLPLVDAAAPHARRTRAAEARHGLPDRMAFPPRSHARLEDRQFEAMEQAFARHGGMATADGVARMMRCRSEQPISELARWLVDRRVVQVEWQGHTLLPLFQFDREHMTLRPEVAEALGALAQTGDDWDVALWFATAHGALGNDLPVDALRRDPAAVGEAARADKIALHD